MFGLRNYRFFGCHFVFLNIHAAFVIFIEWKWWNLFLLCFCQYRPIRNVDLSNSIFFFSFYSSFACVCVCRLFLFAHFAIIANIQSVQLCASCGLCLMTSPMNDPPNWSPRLSPIRHFWPLPRPMTSPSFMYINIFFLIVQIILIKYSFCSNIELFNFWQAETMICCCTVCAARWRHFGGDGREGRPATPYRTETQSRRVSVSVGVRYACSVDAGVVVDVATLRLTKL